MDAELKLADAFELAKTHIPWSSMKSILKDLKIPTSIGWEKSYSKIIDSYKKDELGKIADSIYQSYIDSIFYGNKVLRIAKTDSETSKLIINELKGITPSNSSYSSSYPKPIDLATLKSESILPKLVSISESSDKNTLSLVFCAKRHYFVRETFEVDTLGESVQKAFNEYDSIVALKSISRQCFDIVRVHSDGYIELAADHIDEIGLDDHRMFIGNLFNELTTLLSDADKFDKEQIKFLSLSKLLKKLYDENEGRIVEIGHDTGVTGGVVTEKMRRKSMDVREEVFHKGGMDASTGVSLFSLAKTWAITDSDAEPELYLPGSIRTLSSSLGTYEAILKGCISKTHYDFIISKIKKYSI
nr:hypothetical protein [uncultured Methylotenera sp.]